MNQFLTLSNGKHPNLLTPDPSQKERHWNGRISGRNTLDAVTFDANDDFFPDTLTPAQRTAAETAQGAFNAAVLNEAYSFMNAPYSWGGHNYGGKQSEGQSNYTLSEAYGGDGVKTDSAGTPGNSQSKVGYGLDCNGLIIEGVRLGGRSSQGDLSATTFATSSNTDLIPKITDPRHLRAGDIMAWTGAHVVFLRSAPQTEPVGNTQRYQIRGNAETLEARPDPSDRGTGRVVANTRHGDYLTRLATYSKFAKNRILFSSKSRFEAVFGEFSPQSGVFIFKILNSTVNRA